MKKLDSILELAKMQGNYDIIISAGHGGSDSGATYQGLLEKDFTLDISLYMYRRFKQHGVKVALVRNDDSYVSPEDRWGIVKNNAKHAICNHLNAGRGDGSEVIHSIYGNKEFANKIAEGMSEVNNIRRVFTKTFNSNKSIDYYFMHRKTGSTATMILEWYFLDNPKDHLSIKELIKGVENVVEVYLKELCKEYTPFDIFEGIEDWYVDGWLWGFNYFLNDGILQTPYEKQHMTFLKRYHETFGN